MSNLTRPSPPAPANAEVPAGATSTSRGPRLFTTLSNAEIAARVVAGDSALFELLMRRHNRLVFHIARSIVLDDAEAEDVVQESYLRAYLHLGEFRGPRGFTTWLTRIATNEALRRVRRAPRTCSLEAAGGHDAIADLHAAAATATVRARGADEVAMGEELLRLIEVAIDQLPEDFRVVFMLRAVEQLGVAETAACLGINPNTVKTRFHRARERLRKLLGEQVDVAAADAFSFGGTRCDRIVEHVLRRITGR